MYINLMIHTFIDDNNHEYHLVDLRDLWKILDIQDDYVSWLNNIIKEYKITFSIENMNLDEVNYLNYNTALHILLSSKNDFGFSLRQHIIDILGEDLLTDKPQGLDLNMN